MLVVNDPFAASVNMLPRDHMRQVAHHGHQVSMAPGLNPQDAIARIQIVKRDPLDHA
jgi:hypothetical protein